jgi:hypothetical protein
MSLGETLTLLFLVVGMTGVVIGVMAFTAILTRSPLSPYNSSTDEARVKHLGTSRRLITVSLLTCNRFKDYWFVIHPSSGTCTASEITGVDTYTFGCMTVSFDGVNLLGAETYPPMPAPIEDAPSVVGVYKWAGIFFYVYSDLTVKKVIQWQ